jgi:hypothetical protein
MIEGEKELANLDEIHTSFFIPTSGRDFRIIIRPPSVEYSIPSSKFLFFKNLSRAEINDFIESGFEDWTSRAIRCLTQYKKFNDVLVALERGQLGKIR